MSLRFEKSKKIDYRNHYFLSAPCELSKQAVCNFCTHECNYFVNDYLVLQ